MPAIRKKTFPKEFELKKEPVIWCQAPGDVFADILEVGPGNGDFLLTLAVQNPSKKIAAIEIREKRFKKISKRLEKAALQNVTLIWGNAKVVIPRFFKENALEKIYILFPDPWPKRRHSFHRLLDEEFLSVLGERLKNGGELIFATDSTEYAEWVTKIADKTTFFEKIPYKMDFHETFFEKVWKKEGKNIKYLAFARV